MPRIYNKRGTRVNLNTLAAGNGLAAGELYLISDENRIAVGLSANTYETYAKQSEASGGGGYTPPWAGKIIASWGDGNPEKFYQIGAGLSPSSITTSVVKCEFFKPAFNINVKTIRGWGWSGTPASGVWRCAIYRLSDGVRITDILTFTTTASAMFVVASGLNLDLLASETYIMATAVNSATSTPMQLGCLNNIYARQAANSLSGNADADANFIGAGVAQFATTSGDLPTTLPTLVDASQTNYTHPIYLLDNAA